MKRFLLFAIVILFSSSLFANIPDGYYDTATGTGYTLKTQLHNIIKSGHVAQDYGDLYDAYVDGDTDPDDGYVWDMYSENPGGTDPYNYEHYVNNCGNYSSEGDCLNREHLFPQGIFNEALPMKTDYHHVVPSDGKVNGMRSSYPFGEVGSASWTSLNGSKLGSCSYSGYSGTVFEPIDEFKGDIARCMLYFATRYEDKVASWSHTMINGTSNQVYADWFLSLLIDWHNQDPVSQKEITRNDIGYTFQGNRNPFIDHPEYVCEIWGGDCGSATKVATPTFSIEAGEKNNDIQVELLCTSDGATVYYTTNGTTPTISSSVYSTAINVNSNTTIKAFAVKSGLDDSNVGSATYTFKVSTPVITPVTGSYNSTQTIEMNCATTGAEIRYTTNATEPSVSSNLYTGSFNINSNTTIKAIALKANYTNSEIAQEDYTFNIFYEDFETVTVDQTVTINGWTVANEVGTSGWEGREYELNKYAQMSAYSTGESNITTWLISPGINLSELSFATLSFKSKDGYNYGDPVELFISTNYSDNPATASWTKLDATFATGAPTNGYATNFTESGNIDLAGYLGKTIYLGFKYIGGDPSLTTTMQIDDVLITGDSGTPPNQLPQILEIEKNPTSPTEAEDVTVSATITDSDGSVSSAKIKWGTSAGVYGTEETMTNSGDVFSGTIPAQSAGTTVYFVIEATDNESGVSTSVENSVTFISSSNQLPQITNIELNPTNPESSESVNVSATITDSDGTVSIAKIKWGLSSGDLSTETGMSNISENSYSGTIPAQSDGAQVYFIVIAEDNDGGLTQSDENSYDVNDPVAVNPVVSDVVMDPLNPTENDNVLISANASDSDGDIESVVLRWKRGESGNLSQVSMNLSGSKYYGQIPKQSTGETIYFTIIATDNDALEGFYDGNYEISASNGIEDIKDSNIQLYPNPITENLNIIVENNDQLKSIKVYNLIGEKIYEIYDLNTLNYSIEFGSYPKGIYIIQIDGIKDSTVKKVIYK